MNWNPYLSSSFAHDFVKTVLSIEYVTLLACVLINHSVQFGGQYGQWFYQEATIAVFGSRSYTKGR